MFKTIRDYLFNEKIRNMHMNDVPLFISNVYKNKKEVDKCYDFIKFIQNKELRYEDKKIHEFLWFEQLSIESKIKVLSIHEDFYKDDLRVHYFYNLEKDKEIKQHMLIGYVESKRHWFEEYAIGNYYSRGKRSGFFKINDLLDNLSGEIIQEHIKNNGPIYFDFVTELKNKRDDNAIKKLTDTEEAIYYKVYREIAHENNSLKDMKSGYLAYLSLANFRMSDENEDFIKLLECFIVFNDPDECRRMKRDLEYSPKLLSFYENCLLKNVIKEEDSFSAPHSKRKRL